VTARLASVGALVVGVGSVGCRGDAADSAGGTGDPDAAFAACSSDAIERRSVQLSEVRLDVACQGDMASGTPILLLHGFPEFWMGQAPVMERLAAAGHPVVAPDQRGYNTSDKPDGLDAYALERMQQDTIDLIDLLGGEVVLVGHDWGGAVAWAVASDHPERVQRLVIANAPHMNVFRDLLESSEEQRQAFSYVELFLSPGAEGLLSANDYAALAASFDGVLTDGELAAYKAAWAQPGALTGGLSWYRANFDADGLPDTDRELMVDVPTLVMWGMDDTALLPANLDGLPAYVSDLTVEEVPGATHWINHEVPDRVSASIEAFIE